MKNKINETLKKIKQESGSKTFCPLPWIHIATRPNGDARLCCTANASGAYTDNTTSGLIASDKQEFLNYGKQGIEEIVNSQFMKNVRLAMKNDMIPDSCRKCFEEEKNGIVSKRLWESNFWLNKNTNFAELISTMADDGTIPFNLKYLDLRLGNTCNLACAMCSPHDSSRWVGDHSKLKTITSNENILSQIRFDLTDSNFYWYENLNFWNEIYSQIDNITEIYFAGGEPLAIKEHDLFLKKLIEQGKASNIGLRYNSNGLLIKQETIDLWEKFKSVKFAISIDSLNKKNQYLRYPTDWNILEDVLDMLDKTSTKIEVSIEATVQALNIFDLPDLVKWKLSKKYKKINNHYIEGYQSGGGLINIHLLYIPNFMSAKVLPYNLKKELTAVYMDFKQWLWDNYTQDTIFWNDNPYGWQRWENILNFVNSEDYSHKYKDMIEYLDKLDIIRSTNWRTTFPKLESAESRSIP